MKAIIVPEVVTRGEASNGKPFLSVKYSDGTVYRVWEQKFFGYFQEGKEIEIEYKKNSKGFNEVMYIGKIERNQEPRRPFTGRRGGFNSEERSKGMARGACFNKACDIVIAIYNRDLKVKESDIEKKIRKYFKILMEIDEKEEV